MKKWTRRRMPHSRIRRLEQLAIQPIARNVLFGHLCLISAGQWTLASACLGSRSVALEEQLTRSYEEAIGGSSPQIFFCFPKFFFYQKTLFQRYVKNLSRPTMYFSTPNLKIWPDTTGLSGNASCVKIVVGHSSDAISSWAFALGKMYSAPRFR